MRHELEFLLGEMSWRLVQFGSSTVLSFKDPYRENVVLKEDDIFFLDFGPVWDGVEGLFAPPVVCKRPSLVGVSSLQLYKIGNC